MPLGEIDELVARHLESPERREGQQRLAEEVTRLVHGEQGLQAAVRASNALFGGELTGLSARELAAIFADVPSSEMDRARLNDGLTALDLLVDSGFVASKGEGRRGISSGGFYLNNQRISDASAPVTESDLLGGNAMVLRHGKKKYFLVRFT